MKNMKFWRTALVATLVLTVMLSVTGGTIAWFTDEVTSANNVIKSGTLDVEMSWSNTQNGTYTDASKGAIFTHQLWEPGYTDVKYIKVENKGNLAFKYQLNIKPTVQVAAGEVNLADVIEVYFGEGTAPANTAALHEAKMAGTISELALDADGAAYGVLLPTGEQKKEAFEEVGSVTRWIALHMKEEAGNEYQNKSVGEGFVLELLATQYTYEKDSFGKNYDAEATYGVDNWNGETDGSWLPTEGESENVDEYIISTAEQLADFAAKVNAGESFDGKTIKLGNNIDLNNRAWTPIGDCESGKYFQGTFDGQGHTISGLNVDKSTDKYENSTAGFFGWIDAAAATIKNVNFDGATVKGSHWVGVVAGYMTGEISNCHVTNSTVTGYNVNDDANGDKVGGIVGYMNTGAGKLDGNSVKNSTISGNRDVAGLAGAVAVETNTVTNNHVENVDVYYNADYAAAIVSAKTAVVVDVTNTATNVNVIKGRTIFTAKELREFAEDVNKGNNNYSGKTVVLMANIDLENADWEPIGQTGGTRFQGTFDGQGYTISNLKVDSTNETGEFYSSGLFGWLTAATVKNVKIDGANIIGAQYVGAIAGYLEWSGCTVNNCHVKNVTVTAKHISDKLCGDKAGAVVGYAGNENTPIQSCTAEDSAVYASRDAGQIVGAAKTANVKGCNATNVTVSKDTSVECTDIGAGENITNNVIGREL